MSGSATGVRDRIVGYVLENHPSDYERETMPLDESLLELGVLDSYGVVELIAFLETEWQIQIPDADITKEKMGLINKMTTLVIEKAGLH